MHNSGAPLGLAIMFVCRKTYEETKLLPFTLNPVYCNSLAILQKLSTRITLEQRLCVKDLRLLTQVGQSCNVCKLRSSTTPRLTAILPKIQSVHMTVANESLDRDLIRAWTDPGNMSLRHKQMLYCLDFFLYKDDGEKIHRVYAQGRR